MKKGLILILMFGAILFISMLGSSVTYEVLRGNGVSGTYYYVGTDTADTNSSGLIQYRDTVYSDTFDLDTNYGYLNFMISYDDFDTNLASMSDTTEDTIICYTISRFGHITPCETLFTDTITDIPTSVWHKVITDTMCADRIHFEWLIWDSLAISDSVGDTNSYHMQIYMLGGGSR